MSLRQQLLKRSTTWSWQSTKRRMNTKTTAITYKNLSSGTRPRTQVRYYTSSSVLQMMAILTNLDSEGKRPRLDTELSNASSASAGSLQQAEGSTVTYDPIRYDSAGSLPNSPPTIQGLSLPFQSHGPPTGFRGGPSPSMHLPPLSQSIGAVPSLVTAGQLGATAIVETGTHRGVGRFRTQAYPIVTSGETKESLRTATLPPIKTEPTMSLPIGVSAPNTRRSMNTPASFLRKDTTGTSQSTSSRSANFSSHGSHGSSAYSPVTPMEESQPLRALPLPPLLAAQSSGDSMSSSDRTSMYASPTPSSMTLPQPMQPGQMAGFQANYSTPSPSGKQTCSSAAPNNNRHSSITTVE